MSIEFLGRGFAFPLGSVDHSGLLSGAAKVQQSIFLILSTDPGERLMQPEFGCGLRALVFAPNTDALRSMVELEVSEALTRWEPRIDVLSVVARADEYERHRMLIDIKIRLRENNNTFNLTYPFLFNEGVGLPDPAEGAFA